MKKLILLFFLSFSLGGILYAQESPSLPVEVLTDLDGNKLNKDIFENGENPIILSFWATWCGPCLEELKSIKAIYPNWKKESGVKLIAISIDRERQLPRVKKMVAEKDWPFEVYMDMSGDFRTALNVVNIPHTFVLGPDGKIIYQSTSYSPGDEKKLYEQVKAAKSD